MSDAPSLLLLAVYGMEVVEAGGALARHADAGGPAQRPFARAGASVAGAWILVNSVVLVKGAWASS